MDVDVLIDELYALPLERFVAERDVLVRQLRASKRREDAARVAALVKPSIVAWAVNQVVRSRGDEAAALWAAGDAVLAAQHSVVAGSGSGAALRDAVTAERRALAPLAEAARGLVTGSGKFLGEQNVQVLVETLHAAAVDPSLREDVAAGRLAKPLALTGLGAAVSERPEKEAAAAQAREKLVTRDRADADAETARRREAREERARKQALQQALVRAERSRDAARARIGETVAARDGAQAAVERLRADLEDAEAALARAEEELASAHVELERAEDAVESAKGEVQGT